MGQPSPRPGPTGLLCALPEELGGLRAFERARRRLQGFELLELDTPGGPLLACVSGVGKVRSAQAATLLGAAGIGRLLVVGVCGGLRRSDGPGTFLHCQRAFQVDLGVREGREVQADPVLLAAWRAGVEAEAGWFLTADRPLVSAWKRRRLMRAFPGPSVADMETAAAGAVAGAAGIPWAALRAVSDRAGPGTAAAFKLHYPVQAGRAADTVPALLSRLGAT